MSLATRLILTYLLITLGGLLLLGGGAVVLAGRYDDQRRQQELESQSALFAAYVAELAPNAETLAALAPALAQRGALPAGVLARIFRVDGTLISPQLGLGPFPSRAAAALAQSPLPLPISQATGRRYVARAAGSGGIVELSRATDAERAFVRDLTSTVVQAALLAAFTMALVSLLLARSIARPITRLRTFAETLAAGALDERAAAPLVRRNDEIGALAGSLDHMAGQLQARIAEAEDERARLDAVLGGISEGVVAFDATGAPLFANRAALVLTMNGGPASLDALVAIFKDLGLPLVPERPLEHEVMLGNRQLLLIGTLLSTQHSALSTQHSPAAVWVLRDTTRVRALEQARTDFVRAISHELRTPLTALVGTIENLCDDARPDQQAQLAALESEVSRLGRLVGELLRPTLDGALSISERRPVDVGALASELCALLAGRAQRAGVALVCETVPNLPLVRGDRDRLRQALLNLLDNALKFTPAGGHVQVRVQGGSRQGQAAVLTSVEDDGPGIPAKLRERVWERGVSGAELGLGEGGAGLGLGLVREIVRSHGGDARAEANEPRGTRFIIVLPL